MPRVLWKGAITFGLVHIPVALYPASRSDSFDFNLLDRRDMAPVGNKRVNKQTGEEIPKEEIVKGFQYEDGHYVVLSDEEIKAANVKSTQSVEILAFVDEDEIPPVYYDAPYYLAPTLRGEKVYSLLREALTRTGKAGIAELVIQTKKHLAVLIPMGKVLLLNTLRWATEVRSADELELPEVGAKGVKLTGPELKMAMELIESMSEKWKPESYRDTFRDDIMQLVKRKIETGQTEIVAAARPEAPAGEGAEIIDLTELLRRSLRGGEPVAKTARKSLVAAKTARQPARQKRGQSPNTGGRKRA